MTESVKKNKEIRTNRYFWIACIVLVLLQYGLCIHYGLKRQYLFCDEVYSYGLANSTDKTFLHPGEDNTPLDEWVTGSYFENYMNYNDDSFNYSAAYRNQENDVHPPVYYMLLHTVCYFFKGAGYSAVPGIVLNLILLIFVDILLLYVAAYLLGNRWYGLMAAALWGVSSVGISNCMLIRMYLLQTLNVLLLTAVHVYILRHKKKMTVPYFILLALAVMFGGLTHYYFYFYVAGLGLCVCIYLLYMRKVKQMFAYGFSLVAGLGAAIAVFPATIKHIFGYRGSYATDNLIGLSGHKFLYYISYINRSYFAGLLPLIVLVALVLIVARIVLSFVDIKISLVRENDGLSYRVCIHRRDIDADRTGRIESRSLLLAGVIVADAVLAFVGIQGVRACKCKIYLLGTSYSGCVYDMVYDEAGSSNNQEEMCSCNRCHMPGIMCRQYSCKGYRLAVHGLQRLEHSLGGDEGTGLYHTVSRRWQMEQRVRGNERIFPDGKMPVCVRG